MIQFDASKNQDMPHFTINGALPSLNEYLAACNRAPQIGASLKRKAMETASWEIRNGLGRWKPDSALIIHYVFYEANRRRDHDNVVAFATKTVQDALQKCGVIENDGWNEIKNYTHDFYVDKSNPRIEVYLEEV